MKILLCLSGQVRSFPPFFESFRRNVVERLPGKPDLVAHFSAPEVAEAQRLREIADRSEIRFAPDPELGDVERYEQAMLPQRNGVRGNLLQWHDLEQCGELKRRLEAERGPYDLVLWTRPDLYYVTPIEELRTPPLCLHIPAHDCYRGLMDRMCYGPSASMDARMRIRTYFLDHFHPKRVLGAQDPAAWNPERVLAALVEDELEGRVARTRLVTLRVRETPHGYEVCRPACRVGKDPHEGCDDPLFRAVFRRSERLSWGPKHGGPDARRLPLEYVDRRLASGRSGWAGLRARFSGAPA